MFSGVFIGLSPAAIAQISPTEKLGARIGAYLLPTALATLVGTPISGAFVPTGTEEQYRKIAIYSVSHIIVLVDDEHDNDHNSGLCDAGW